MILFKKNISRTIKIGYTKLKISLPIFVAKDLEYFDLYGLKDIEFIEFETAQELVGALINDEIHFGGYCALPVALEAMAENPTKKMSFITGVFEDTSHPLSFLLGKNKIKSFRELENKRIGYFPTNAYKIWLHTILKSKYVIYNEDNLIEVNTTKQIDSLKNGKVDFLLTNDPIATKIIGQNVAVNLLQDDNAIIPDILDRKQLYYGSFIVLKSYVEENPQIVKSVSNALDKAIKKIQSSQEIGNSIRIAIKKYLSLSEKIANNIRIPLYKTTKEVTNRELDTAKDSFFDQNILLKKVTTEKLQYHRKSIGAVIKKGYGKIEASFEKNKLAFTIIGFLPSALIAYWVSVSTTKQGINSQKEQFQLQLVQERKNLPSQFILKYDESIERDKKRAYLVNIGYSTLLDVEADIDYYFISKQDTVHLASILYKTLSNNEFDKIKSKSNKYSNRQQLKIDLNEYRELSIKNKLEPAKEKNIYKIDIKDENSGIAFDNSSTVLSNAIEISEILNYQIIARWKISYYEEISKELKTTSKYILFTKNELLTDKFGTDRVNLDDIVGGQRLINLIENYETNSKDMIYE